MKDFLVRGAVKEPSIRFAFAETTALCRDGIIAHNCDPTGGAVLADALSATALLSVLLDGSEKYSVKLAYAGRAGTVLTDVNAACDVRGMIANPQLGDGDTSPDALFGTEDIPVSVLKFDKGAVLNSGTVKCGMAAPSDDIAMFFSISDQIETEIVTVCRFRPDPADPVVHAASFLLQAMPGCDLEAFGVIREKLHTASFQALLSGGELPMELQLKKLLAALDFADTPENIAYTQAGTPGFRCHCSKSSMKRALLTLGKEGLADLFAAQQSTTIRCNFCGKQYSFTAKDL